MDPVITGVALAPNAVDALIGAGVIKILAVLCTIFVSGLRYIMYPEPPFLKVKLTPDVSAGLIVATNDPTPSDDVTVGTDVNPAFVVNSNLCMNLEFLNFDVLSVYPTPGFVIAAVKVDAYPVDPIIVSPNVPSLLTISPVIGTLSYPHPLSNTANSEIVRDNNAWSRTGFEFAVVKYPVGGPTVPKLNDTLGAVKYPLAP
jgi:hypothetical protein